MVLGKWSEPGVNRQRAARHIVHRVWSETLFGGVDCLGLVAISMLIAM
jgi:hypothetical protein